MTRNPPVRALLVEDDAGHALLVKEMVRLDPRIELGHVDRLQRALESLVAGTPGGDFDVVLLDLGLPDSQGMDTIRAVLRPFPRLPIVVLSGHDDDRAALEAIQAGAQDYLVKMRTDSELLLRTLLHAIERKRLLEELAAARQFRRDERERRQLERLTLSPDDGEDEQTQHPLQLRAPAVFEQFAEHYRQLLDLAIEQRNAPIDEHIPSELETMAVELATYRADRRDVLEVHRRAMLALLDHDDPDQRAAYSEEGRFLVLELMGCLVSDYRRQCLSF